MTHHPTPEQVQTVIDNLKKIEDQANQAGAFAIDEIGVNTTSHDCGTVHCVAGWYAVANQDHAWIKHLINVKACDYLDGAHLIAMTLGFHNINDLGDYMLNRPDIWGNELADEMFCSMAAYNGLEEDSKNPMSIIIAHWEQVKRNVEKIG